MQENIKNTLQSDSDLNQSQSCNVPLWNPNVAGIWSLFLSPVFGSILVYKNWKSLGEENRLGLAKIWIIISITVVVNYLIYSAPIAGLLYFVYVLIWYFASQRKQAQFLKSKYSGKYEKKGWLKPIIYAFLAIIGVGIGIGIIEEILGVTIITE